MLVWPLTQFEQLKQRDDPNAKNLKPYAYYLPGNVIEDLLLWKDGSGIFVTKKSGPPHEKAVCFVASRNFNFCNLE